MKKITDLLSSKNYALAMTLVAMISPIAYAEMEIPGSFATSSLPSFTATSSGIIPFEVTFPAPIYEEEEKVRKGRVLRVYDADGYFVLVTAEKQLSVYATATTTLHNGDGDPIALGDLDKDTRVYVFGHMRSDGQEIMATKIVTANKNKFFTLRK